jgi:hypothetical protein
MVTPRRSHHDLPPFPQCAATTATATSTTAAAAAATFTDTAAADVDYDDEVSFLRLLLASKKPPSR